MKSNRKLRKLHDRSDDRDQTLPVHIRPVSAVALEKIKPNPHNPRTHSKKQIGQIADSMRAFGSASPVLLDEHGVLLAGHARLEAAKLLRLKAIPAIVIDGLSQARKRALLLADNRIAQSAGWDRERLARELMSLPDLLIDDGLDITLTGFEPAEIDALLADFAEEGADPADALDPAQFAGPQVSQSGDFWQLGKHRLLCGDARDASHNLVNTHVARVEVQAEQLAIKLVRKDKQKANGKSENAVFYVPWKKNILKRRREIIVPASSGHDVRPIRSETRVALVTSIACGRRWLNEIVTGSVDNAEQIATREKCSVRQVNMTISLAFLSPTLSKAAIDGRLPRGIGIARLRDAPAEWSRQHAMLELAF